MWISKKKLDDILNKMNNKIEELEHEVKALSDCHKKEYIRKYYMKPTSFFDKCQGLPNIEITPYSKYSHDYDRLNTSISDITLEELARLVIDHEPIVREENVKVKVEYR